MDTVYHPDGSRTERFYRGDGKELWSKEYDKDDKQNGMERFYHPDGSETITFYRNGDKLWKKEYDKNCRLLNEILYKDNNNQENKEVNGNLTETLKHEEEKNNQFMKPDTNHFER